MPTSPSTLDDAPHENLTIFVIDSPQGYRVAISFGGQALIGNKTYVCQSDARDAADGVRDSLVGAMGVSAKDMVN